jgi:hypothetical protein
LMPDTSSKPSCASRSLIAASKASCLSERHNLFYY